MIFRLKHFGDFLSCNETIFTDKDLSLCVERAVFVEDVNYRQIVFLAQLIVVHVVCRRYFQTTGSEIHRYIVVFNDGNGAVDQRDQRLVLPSYVEPGRYAVEIATTTRKVAAQLYDPGPASDSLPARFPVGVIDLSAARPLDPLTP